MATTVIGGMLAATIIAILLIPVTYYVVERFAANRKQRALHGVPRPREQHRDWNVILFAPTKLRGRLARAEPVFPQERVSPVPWLANPSGGCTTEDGSCRKRCGAGTCFHLAHHREPRLHLDHHPLFATVLLQVAIQTVSVLNQIRLFVVDVNARSRLSTAFMSSNFIGGAISSSLAGVLWQSGGWFSLTAGAVVLIGLALIVWLTQREQALE